MKKRLSPLIILASVSTHLLITAQVNAVEPIPGVPDPSQIPLVEKEGGFFSNRVGFGLEGGTNGWGGHVTYDIFTWLYVKGHFQQGSLDIDHDFEINGSNNQSTPVNLKGDFNLKSFGASLNLLPFNGAFKLTAGLYEVDNRIKLKASSPGSQIPKIGALNEFTLGSGDQINSNINFSRSMAPYLGLGWDWKFGVEEQIILGLNAGVIVFKELDLSMKADGTFTDFQAKNPGATVADLQTALDGEAEKLKDDAKGMVFYPVISLGLTYRF